MERDIVQNASWIVYVVALIARASVAPKGLKILKIKLIKFATLILYDNKMVHNIVFSLFLN